MTSRPRRRDSSRPMSTSRWDDYGPYKGGMGANGMDDNGPYERGVMGANGGDDNGPYGMDLFRGHR